MFGLVSLLSLGYVAIGVFIPLFVVGLIMLKSLSRALALAMVFAVGATAGFALAALIADWAVGHGVENDTRQAMMLAFCSAGSAAGGALAVWALLRRRNPLI
jgi:hypothetical protein